MNSDPQQLHGIIAAFVGIYFVFYLLMAVAFMVPTGFIAKKAGLSPWLCLLCIFPLTGLILLYILAFIDWKVIPAPQQMTWQPPYQQQPPFPPQV